MPVHRVLKAEAVSVTEVVKRIQRDFAERLVSWHDAGDYIEFVTTDAPEYRDGAA